MSTKVVNAGTLSGEILFADPARREQGRISDPEQWIPPLSEVLACYKSQRFMAVAIKCAPGLKITEIESADTSPSIFFISKGHQLKEAFLLLCPQKSPRKQAIIFHPTLSAPVSLESIQAAIPPACPEPGLYLHNPNPAILRAEALDTLAQSLDAGIVHPKIGYLVGAQPSDGILADSFLIEHELPLNWSKLKKWLSRSPWSEYEYLGRGVPFSQIDVRKRLPKLKRKKKNPALRGSVIIYRKNDGYHVVLAQRAKLK